MSVDLYRRVKVLEGLVSELVKRLEGKPDADLQDRVKSLENRYTMLNARLNKKTNNGDDGRRDPGSP